jgi:F0F1-type ATP synthase membrane subunit c/vacuolar-type H+-ATPase subunit K
MIDPESLNKILRPRTLTMRILWSAMVMTILFFVLVSYFITSQHQSEPVPIQNELRMVFYAIAVIAPIAAYFLRRRMLSSERLQPAMRLNVDLRAMATDSETGVTDEARLADLNKLNPLELKAITLSGRYFTAMLLSLALHEVVALCGMMLSMLEQRFEAILPFAAVAIVLDLLIYPRLDKFIEQNAVPAPRF